MESGVASQIVIIVDPSSTGAAIAKEIERRGYQLVCVPMHGEPTETVGWLAVVESHNLEKMVAKMQSIASKAGAEIVCCMAGSEEGIVLADELATALALQQGGQAARPREPGAGPRERQEPWSVPGWGGWGAERRSAPAPEAMADVAASAGPPRAPGEPPPTVSVPFRVIRRPARPERKPQATSSVDRAPQAASGEATPGGGDDWDSHEEDW
jgi:hypothetical protein